MVMVSHPPQLLSSSVWRSGAAFFGAAVLTVAAPSARGSGVAEAAAPAFVESVTTSTLPAAAAAASVER